MILPPSSQGPDQDLSACTDHPRVRTRVLQHNRFSQLKEKCSEIITKNVRNKSKPTPHVRPNSFSHNANHLNRNEKNKYQTDRRATYNCNRQAKTYELKDVNDIGEGFEIINIDDCLSGDEEHAQRPNPQVELLDLSEKNSRNSRNRSVESLDSGCDIETPRANHIDKQVGVFQKLSLEDNDSTNTQVLSENLNENEFSEMSVDSNKSVRQKSDDSTKSINVVCNIQVGTESTKISTQISTNSEISQECPNNKHQEEHLDQKTESTQDNELCLDDTRSSEEDDDIPLQFNEIFKLFEPNKTPGEDVSQYADQLRTKLAWKLAAERVLQETETASWTGSEGSRECPEIAKPRKFRSECPVYNDPELEDFISRCFGITLPVQEQLTQIQECEESLMSCFIPKELHIPEISELDLLSIDSASLDSQSWSDGEYLDVND